MVVRVEGIILTDTPYGESSKIVNILTLEYGIIGVMCNGVKSLKSPLRTKTLKFTYGYFHINYNENKLSRLMDVDIIDNFNIIRGDIELISYMSYLSELTYQVVKQNNDKNIFNLFISAIKKINEKHDPLIITNILELKYLDYLGVSLNLDGCCKCGDKSSIVTLDPTSGGYVCSNCYTNERIMDTKSIKLIRMYYLIDISSISNISISKETSDEINYFLDSYYEKYTGLYLKSKKFLKSIENL